MQYLPNPDPIIRFQTQTGISRRERLLAFAGGSMLIYMALRRHNAASVPLVLAAVPLIMRGTSIHIA